MVILMTTWWTVRTVGREGGREGSREVVTYKERLRGGDMWLA